MITKIIELKQVPVVLVELCKDDISYYNVNKYVREGLKEEGFKYLNYLSDLTEEQFAECVGKTPAGNYLDYVEFRGFQNVHETAKTSFYSLLESENVYTENPHDYMLQSTEENFDNCKCGKTELQIVKDRWQEAQSRTIDPTRTIVLIRKEETR